MLVSFGCEVFLTPLERMSMLLAALCHDLRHPGTLHLALAYLHHVMSLLFISSGLNNTYQVNAQTPLSLLYNDQSVLEHHHCASLFRFSSCA